MDREKPLKQLNTPKLGDSLLKADGTPWMASLQHMSPKLNWDDLAQRPANPLGFWLKTDPWDDKVHQLNAKIYAYMNPRDKMPFEVTPIFYKLQRYDAAAAAAAAQPAAPAAGQQQPPADPNVQAPATGGAPAGQQQAPANTGQPAPQQPPATDTNAPQQAPPGQTPSPQ